MLKAIPLVGVATQLRWRGKGASATLLEQLAADPVVDRGFVRRSASIDGPRVIGPNIHIRCDLEAGGWSWRVPAWEAPSPDLWAAFQAIATHLLAAHLS